eukprot:COSAG06_NODE_7428_length_2508_cov_12.536322_3_plen_587_part_01
METEGGGTVLPSIFVPHGSAAGDDEPDGGMSTPRPRAPPLASPVEPRSARQPSGHRDPRSSRRSRSSSKKKDGLRLRRFFFNELTHGVKPTLPLHYDVLMPSRQAKDSEHDHLRYRYVDFVCSPTTAWHGMLDGVDEHDAVDVAQLMSFFQVAEPRTRIDAYPMYVLLRDILGRQLNGTLQLKHKEAERLRVEQKELKQKLHEQAERISFLEQQVTDSGKELRKAELVRKHKDEAENALKRAEDTLAELRTNKFKVAAFRKKADNLQHEIEHIEHERTESEGAKWTFVDLEAMLCEALEERGSDDQTLEQAFMLLGEENAMKLHLRMKRAYPTLFKPKTKFKFIIINSGKKNEDAKQPAQTIGTGSAGSEEDELNRRLHQGVSKEEEAEIHYRLAHVEEDNMRRHEMDELQARLGSGDLTPGEEMVAREKLHQMEGFERSKSKKDITAKLASGAMTQDEAHLELLTLDAAGDHAQDRAKLVAKIKSGKLSGEELVQAQRDLQEKEHEKHMATVSLVEPAGATPPEVGLDGVATGVQDLVNKAEHLRFKLMDPNMSDAQKKKLQMELDDLVNASEGAFQATMKIDKDE